MSASSVVWTFIVCKTAAGLSSEAKSRGGWFSRLFNGFKISSMNSQEHGHGKPPSVTKCKNRA